MGRYKKRPGYDQERIQNQMIKIASELYHPELNKSDNDNKKTSLRNVADELDISVSKTVKLLITGGAYTSDISNRVLSLYTDGHTIHDIQKILGVSRATVQSYLPYKKGIYNAKETSLNAERIKRYRERCEAINRLKKQGTGDSLWECIIRFEEYGFRTVKGMKFRYTVCGGEIFVDRKEGSKSITRSTVNLAYKNALRILKAEGRVEGPKKLGTFGASYLYPMLVRFGVISYTE